MPPTITLPVSQSADGPRVSVRGIEQEINRAFAEADERIAAAETAAQQNAESLQEMREAFKGVIAATADAARTYTDEAIAGLPPSAPTVTGLRIDGASLILDMSDGTTLSVQLGSIVAPPPDPGPDPDPEPEPEPGAFARLASTSSMRHIHSGHSLTDTYTNGGIEGFPGDLNQLFIGQFGAEPVWTYNGTHQRMVVPGSPLRVRWNDYPNSEAIAGIGQYDTLMITEAGPPSRPTPAAPTAANETLDYLIRFARNMWQNGRGRREVILWSIWPNTEGWIGFGGPQEAIWSQFGGFRGSLVEYGRVFRFFAEYATWKMRQLHPDLPEDWRIRVFPGHAWWLRVHDDIAAGLVPGITDHRQLFRDDIHPDEVGEYAMAVFVHTMLYQTDTRNDPTWRPSSAVIDPALDTYFRRIAWEIATAQESVGMGGTEDAAPSWTLAAYGDLLGAGYGGGTAPDPDPDPDPTPDPDPDPDPEPGAGEVPEDRVMAWSATDGYQGPAPSTAVVPFTAAGNIMTFPSHPGMRFPRAFSTQMYFCGRFRLPGTENPDDGDVWQRDFLKFLPAGWNNTWDNGRMFLRWHQNMNQLFLNHNPGSGWEEEVFVSANAPRDTWITIECALDGATLSLALDGGPAQTVTIARAFDATSQVRLLQQEISTPEMQCTGMVLLDRQPTTAERSAIREWVGVTPTVV